MYIPESSPVSPAAPGALRGLLRLLRLWRVAGPELLEQVELHGQLAFLQEQLFVLHWPLHMQ